MNHKALLIAPIVAALALTAVAFAVPQQAFAHHYHHNNSVRVNQQIDQLNNCTAAECANFASNNADIDK